MQLAVELSPIAPAAIVVSANGHIVEASQSARAMLGLRSVGPVAAPCWKVVAGRTRDGRPACSPDCPILSGASGGARFGPDEEIVSGGRSGSRPPVRVWHIPVRVAGSRFVIHHLSDMRTRAARDRIADRFDLIVSGPPSAERSASRFEHVGGLTPRELEILRSMSEGLTTREVAERLGIRPTTVRNHVARLLSKLGARNRVEALANFLRGEPGQPRDQRGERPPPPSRG